MHNISIIAAIAKNYAIGRNNKLLWHISEDMKRFKSLTTGHTVVMGKKTYGSLPVRPLPNRRNVVITDDMSDRFEGCIMSYSIDDAIQKLPRNEESFIIGGASIYKQFLPLADKLYLTVLDKDFKGDTFFPRYNTDEWKETENISRFFDEKLGFSYAFITLTRK